ncbi:MAG: hypothetical protein JSW05_01940 [Candidatus Thorarchaeota archaeon]|nr:MAG: hypothetical protein JSW05_01940 [Candidatus Thorarchaeota archaeon]
MQAALVNEVLPHEGFPTMPTLNPISISPYQQDYVHLGLNCSGFMTVLWPFVKGGDFGVLLLNDVFEFSGVRR